MSTLNIQVTYDDKVHQFNLVRENLHWNQLVAVLQSSIPQAASEQEQPFVLYYSLDGESHQIHDQDTFSQLLSFPGILGLYFYGNNMQEKMKSVYILPPTNAAFKKLSDFVDEHYSELENNRPLSRAIGMLASAMTLSPGNYDDEMNELERFIVTSLNKGDKWKEHKKLRKQGHRLFKKLASRHLGSHMFSPYFFMDKRHGFPHAPPPHFEEEEYGTELHGFASPLPPAPHHRHHHPIHHAFGRRGGCGRGHMKGFGRRGDGRHGCRAPFDYPAVYVDLVSDEVQDEGEAQTEINEKEAPAGYEDTPIENESESGDSEEEEFFFELPFDRPHGRPDFGHGGFGGRGRGRGRGGFGGRGGHFGGPGFGRPDFGRPDFEESGFEGPGFEGPDFEGPGFGPGFHGRGGYFGGPGGRGRGFGHSRGGPRGRGGHFGGPDRFSQGPVGPDFDFLKTFTHDMPSQEHKHFYFA